MASKKDKELLDKEAAERVRVEKERREGEAALQQARADEAAKTEKQRDAEEEQARREQEEKAAAELARVEEEQRLAAEKMQHLQDLNKTRETAGDEPYDEAAQLRRALAELSADARLLKAGTVIHLNGEAGRLPVDLPIVIDGAADEQYFASILARDPVNLRLNADLLRLVYNPMNGTPLPLSSQRLSLEEMTEQERNLFESATLPRRR